MLTERLKEFMETSGQNPDPYVYKTLVYEEFAEWRDSENGSQNDFKETIDMIVVLAGYAVAWGWDPSEGFKRVMDNNIGRMIQDDGTIQRRQDGKIIKNPNYPKVDLKDATIEN